MIAAVRKGESQRSVARHFRVSLRTVQRWLERAEAKRLDRVDWSNRSGRPHRLASRTDSHMEDLIIETRQQLRKESDLGEYGAQAVYRTLVERAVSKVPSVRTINRIFERWGLLDHKQRVRRKAPPRGWYVPDVAHGRCEIDQVDIVEGLKIKDGPLVEVLNVVSLHGGFVGSWPEATSVTARTVEAALVAHWHTWGLPDYAQFDNDTVFQGPHQHPDVVSRVMRLCLSLDVVPVFVPPREMGFQASIEAYNGLWQAKVWGRFEHESLEALQGQSSKYVVAHRRRTTKRRAAAPPRRVFPAVWQLDLQRHPASYERARIVLLRRTSQSGAARLLGRSFEVDPQWAGRLVRCEVLLSEEVIRFYRLRRRAPEDQPLLREVAYRLPERRFRE